MRHCVTLEASVKVARSNIGQVFARRQTEEEIQSLSCMKLLTWEDSENTQKIQCHENMSIEFESFALSFEVSSYSQPQRAVNRCPLQFFISGYLTKKGISCLLQDFVRQIDAEPLEKDLIYPVL